MLTVPFEHHSETLICVIHEITCI